MADRRVLLAYRDRLFPPSEIAFLRRQYVGFSRLAPVWVGRHREPGPVPEGMALGPLLTGAQGLVYKQFGLVPGLERFRQLRPVCVHAQFGRGGALALPLARALSVPLVVTFHGSEVDKASYYRWFPVPSLFRLRLERLKAEAGAFVCISQNARERLLARGFPVEKTHALPIGTDMISSHPRAAAGEGVVFIGRFAEMKGIPVLIEAMRRLRRQGCEAPLTLIGDGPLRAEMMQAAADVPGLYFTGWQSQDEVRAALAGARLLCVPSVITAGGESEGLPSVAMEAMGLGVPVVASSEARVEGLVIPEQTGVIFPSRDAAALADVLARLLNRPDLALRMGEAARVHVRARFNAMVQSRALEDLLLQLC
ncbi:MAG: glycosyltransferase [Proteobacteria bacterium]|nr:glycosyltransferase [Pseudomonadota bacterium]MBU6426041.1 glycosyltransferase [Rhodospirillales bacterium]